MARIFKAPIDAPPLTGLSEQDGVERYRAAVEQYEKRVGEIARERHERPVPSEVGRVVRFQIADGYASYIVWRTRPLQLVHLDEGDGYSITAAEARGLRLTDVREKIRFDDFWRQGASEHDKFYESLPIGAIVHYDNAFGQFIRAERIEGERGKRLRPLALVGNWPEYDLPRRNVDGSVTLGYQAEKIAEGRPFEPNYGSIWEAMDAERREWTMRGLTPEGTAHLNAVGRARFAEKLYQAPFDPATAEAIDLTPPPPPEGDARALATYVQRLQQIVSAIGETPRTLDEAKAKYAEVRSLVVPDFQLPEPVLE